MGKAFTQLSRRKSLTGRLKHSKAQRENMLRPLNNQPTSHPAPGNWTCIWILICLLQLSLTSCGRQQTEDEIEEPEDPVVSLTPEEPPEEYTYLGLDGWTLDLRSDDTFTLFTPETEVTGEQRTKLYGLTRLLVTGPEDLSTDSPIASGQKLYIRFVEEEFVLLWQSEQQKLRVLNLSPACSEKSETGIVVNQSFSDPQISVDAEFDGMTLNPAIFVYDAPGTEGAIQLDRQISFDDFSVVTTLDSKESFQCTNPDDPFNFTLPATVYGPIAQSRTADNREYLSMTSVPNGFEQDLKDIKRQLYGFLLLDDKTHALQGEVEYTEPDLIYSLSSMGPNDGRKDGLYNFRLVLSEKGTLAATYLGKWETNPGEGPTVFCSINLSEKTSRSQLHLCTGILPDQTPIDPTDDIVYSLIVTSDPKKKPKKTEEQQENDESN